MKTYQNGERIALNDLDIQDYGVFSAELDALLQNALCHCIQYFAYPQSDDQLRLIACVADDGNQGIYVLAAECPRPQPDHPVRLASLTPRHHALHGFEREIWENWGIEWEGHPWLKPIRYPANRYHADSTIEDYPFYRISGGQLHEVGVGPIHAGVIEPGHFRFLCHGEMVYHLEIQLGWQHRGVESLYLQKTKTLQRHTLSESIAGDTAIGHNWAHTRAIESLANIRISKRLSAERSIALELERLAMHLFDINNLFIGIAYQLGNSVVGALRTPVINFLQDWSGNRFGKGLIRLGGTHYPLTEELRQRLWAMLEALETRFREMARHAYHLPSVQNRFDGIGKLTLQQLRHIGAVGLTARMGGLVRDIRTSHPHDAYLAEPYDPILQENGDVLARIWMRRLEVKRSIRLVRGWLAEASYWAEAEAPKPQVKGSPALAADSMVVSLVEGWRGEICHVAITDAQGHLKQYKVKDPSFHNWMALALSLRNLEISDFPINNKSYDLSYCGHDL